MKSLYDYDVLVNDTFYRTCHILEYIKLNPNMEALDEMAIKATIMDALVSTYSIDPAKEELDFAKLCITKVHSVSNYKYEDYPLVMGIPFQVKERARLKCVRASGGVPISFIIANPTQEEEEARFCIYDADTAFSALFPKHTFYKASYISPTRKSTIAKDRPFVEVDYNGVFYLVDLLTKRYFRSDFFSKNFAMKIESAKHSSSYNKFEKEYYQEQIRPLVSICSYAEIMLLKKETLESVPKYAEIYYEIEKSKENFKNEWNRELNRDIPTILYSSKDGIVLKKTNDDLQNKQF